MECEDVMNVCRLCLETDNLIFIFDDSIQIPKNMKDIIQITTGVSMSPSDKISQKLCYKCINITIRMFKFRSSSIVNDLQLKEKVNVRRNISELHKSIQSLLNQYPKIVLPSSITRLNISPVVKINRNKIRNWMAEYRKEKKLERTISRDKPEIGDNQLISDSESNITPYISSNEDMIPMEQEEQNLGDIEKDGNVALSPTSEPPTSVDEIRSSTGRESPIKPITDIEKDSSASINSQPLSKENKSKREPPTNFNASKRKKIKLNSSNDDINSLLDLKYVKECIYLCDICNSILYSNKDLKKHRNKHMRCCLCKRRFRSMQETEQHSQSHCPIKEMMDNLPRIRIQRCDQSNEIRQQYPSAFGLTPDEQNEILPIEQTPQIQSETSPHESDILDYSEIDDAKVDILQTIIPDNEFASEEEKPLIQCTSQTPLSCVKPEIEITGSCILNLNLDDDEMSLVKYLLKQFDGNMKESSTQTSSPSNCEIISLPDRDDSFEMRNLRDYLNYYKIPVNISYAAKYSAKYGNESAVLAEFHNFSWSIMRLKRKTPTHSDKTAILQNINIERNSCTEEINEVQNTASTKNMSFETKTIESTDSDNRVRSSGISVGWQSSGNIPYFWRNTIAPNDVAANNIPRRVYPGNSKSCCRIRMNPVQVINVNTTRSSQIPVVLENNFFPTNPSNKISSFRGEVPRKPVYQLKELPYNIHKNHIFHAPTPNPTNVSPNAMSYRNTNNLMMRRANEVAPMQDHGLLNTRASVALETFAKVRKNGSFKSNTTSVGSNNAMTTLAVPTSTLSQDSRNGFTDIPTATNYNTTANSGSAHVSKTSIINNYGKSNPHFASLNNVSQTTSYKKSSENINYQSIFTRTIEQCRMSATSSSGVDNSSILTQKRNSAISTMSLPINNNPLQTPVIVASQPTDFTQEPGGLGIRTINSEISDGRKSQSASTTASTSQWNRNLTYPLIRVKNVSELR